ncbi:MAG: alpha-1,4 glucan phosphorylase [Gemmatimonadales bacterium]|nr:MAG: alpha-1,4 glucan phosphorylase [Gemmatimonadales bacterium]
MNARHSTIDLPERIGGLAGLATNLFWSWDRDARRLFRTVDPQLWHITWHNPLELLRRVSPERLAALAQDPGFLELYDRVMERLDALESGAGSWFSSRYPDLAGRSVAYFCAEFAFHNSVPIYSGGLGVLAGDHCKAASDLGVPLVAVGLLYTRGYFDQRVDVEGRQHDVDEVLERGITPLTPVLSENGDPFLTKVWLCGRWVHVGVWKLAVGRAAVHLLDTDLEINHPEDRQLSHRLYASGADVRLRQEWVLGVAGVRVLRALGVAPDVWHANEGHAGFMLIERLRELVAGGASFEQAVDKVRASSLFTTHTPVPAGHDVFAHQDLDRCVGGVWEELGISRERFLALGRPPGEDGNRFHMTTMVLRLCGRVNGVSLKHRDVSRSLWRGLWPGREPSEVPIGYVTNGVHVASWMAYPIKLLLDRHLGAGWEEKLEDPELIGRIAELDDAALWEVHLQLKVQLLDFVREDAARRWRHHWNADARHLAGGGALLHSRPLTIGFARRFTSYKRADLIFRDAERLRRILVDPVRPVQIIFAGKAHPADEPGKAILQRVYRYARDPAFEGRIAFLEDYELHLAHRLVQGVDLWLNLPRPPMEACGTSGMKAALNGVPQISTADGWWAEGYDGSNGWLIADPPDGGDLDAAHAEQLYRLLENQVVPEFYDLDHAGIPATWVRRMKRAMQRALERFTARRMVREYVERYYAPAMRCEPLEDPPPAG